MRIFSILLLLFITLPWLELWLLFRLSNRIGAGGALAVVLLTGMVGAALARAQGASALGRIRRALAEGRVPAVEVVDGFLIFAAGLLLITPGLITDSVGFFLLIPAGRKAVRRLVTAWLRRHVTVHVASPGGPPPPRPPDVIDVDAEEIDEEHGMR